MTRKLTRSVLDKLSRLNNIHVKEKENGDWDIYNSKTGEILETVSKEDVDSATKRLEHKKAQKEKQKRAEETST